MSLGEAPELGREAGSGETITGDCIGLGFPGSAVFAGEVAGPLGRDAGLAASVEAVAGAGIVVGSAGAGAGVGGRSQAVGVKAMGGSKRPKGENPKASLNIPVHAEAHIGSRENISIGGTIIGSQGGPTVETIVPGAKVLNPKPQVGQARSLISSGAITPALSGVG